MKSLLLLPELKNTKTLRQGARLREHTFVSQALGVFITGRANTDEHCLYIFVTGSLLRSCEQRQPREGRACADIHEGKSPQAEAEDKQEAAAR